jgi:acyl phosphate:glycerol-3-phosphate acyltransferase
VQLNAVALSLLAGYLLGSVPFAVLVSHALRLADPRSYGSGNPGATNVLRSGNRIAALLTLIGDGAKGAAAVGIGLALADGVEWLPIASGAAAFVGHLYPLFLRFRGGKGVATYLGVLLALDVSVGLATCALWLAVAYASRYSSLASMVAALAAPGLLAAWRVPPLSATAIVATMAAVLVWRHRANIVKLAHGEEARLGRTAGPGGH